MASLIRRIQSAFLGGARDEELQALLAELGISSGGSGEHALRNVRYGILRSISDEAFLRDAFSNLGVSGGGGGGMQAVGDIRNAILLNLRDSEATLRQGLDGLLTPEDLGSGEGGGSAPAWVPANAKIHIDLLNDRAWTEAAGEVAIDTLLGSDPNTEEGWTETSYDPANLTADGYVGSHMALIGAALTSMAGGGTLCAQFKQIEYWGDIDFAFMSADGNDGIQITLYLFNGPQAVSWAGSLDVSTVFCTNSGAGALNKIAFTLVSDRVDLAANGAAAATSAIDETDRPPANPLVAWLVNGAEQAVQSITIYDPLPSTAGLSELSNAS